MDYIGATRLSLHDRLKSRYLLMRYSIEFLFLLFRTSRTWPSNYARISTRSRKYHSQLITTEIKRVRQTRLAYDYFICVRVHICFRMLRKDRMKLYQHSAHCPAAMQIFLDANPQYWRFVPMSLEEAQQPEQHSIPHVSLWNQPDSNFRSKEDCFRCVEAVPKVPSGYTFSNRQILLQTQYFHKKQDQTLPGHEIDLYNATVVAVCKSFALCSRTFHSDCILF